MNFSRGQLRKLSWLAEIHEYMKAANEAGSITRQEAVSMVPPLFMDVQPHHKVRTHLDYQQQVADACCIAAVSVCAASPLCQDAVTVLKLCPAVLVLC
jgi:hypothetical protein